MLHCGCEAPVHLVAIIFKIDKQDPQLPRRLRTKKITARYHCQGVNNALAALASCTSGGRHRYRLTQQVMPIEEVPARDFGLIGTNVRLRNDLFCIVLPTVFSCDIEQRSNLLLVDGIPLSDRDMWLLE